MRGEVCIIALVKALARNKRASYDYEITEKLIGGLSLTGSEVKSAKAGHASLKGSFVALKSNEAFLTNAHINPYAFSAEAGTMDPLRSRKLLLHRKQLDMIADKRTAGLMAVPLALLLERGLVKLEIGIGRPKKRYDKREAIKKRDQEREARRSTA